MNFCLTILYAFILMTLQSCISLRSHRVAGTEIVDDHTSKTSLDWAGRYTGSKSDCKDCPYTLMSYQINEDLSIIRYESRTNNGAEEIITTHGKFKWSTDGQSIIATFDNGDVQSFKVGEHHITVMRGDTPDAKYTRFSQSTHTLEENYWKLKWAYDTDFSQVVVTDREPHIIFKSHAPICQGHDGCSEFKQEYTTTPVHHLQISKNNFKTCPSSVITSQMHNAMKDVHHYFIYGDNMYWLNNNKEIIATFEVVFLR